MDFLIGLDQYLFFLINRDWTNSFFDVILPLFRNRFFWSPLYLFLIVYFIVNHRKNSLLIIGMLFLAFVLADSISSGLIKPFFERLRPCNEPLIKDQVRSLVTCGSGYSFTSSHATNHFAIALFLITFFYKRYAWVLPLGLLWAGSISYAQVYVGVHYPFDVLCGALLGSLIGYTVCRFLKSKMVYV